MVRERDAGLHGRLAVSSAPRFSVPGEGFDKPDAELNLRSHARPVTSLGL
jgi:hypothetical protein